MQQFFLLLKKLGTYVTTSNERQVLLLCMSYFPYIGKVYMY